jgi:hypothetical protein
MSMQEFYDLPPEGLTDEFLDEHLTLAQITEDLRGALKYPSLAEGARVDPPRFQVIAVPGKGNRVALYLTTRRWIWQAIELGRVRPRWKDGFDLA